MLKWKCGHIIQTHSDTVRKRENLISVGFSGNACNLLFSIAVAHTVTLKAM